MPWNVYIQSHTSALSNRFIWSTNWSPCLNCLVSGRLGLKEYIRFEFLFHTVSTLILAYYQILVWRHLNMWRCCLFEEILVSHVNWTLFSNSIVSWFTLSLDSTNNFGFLMPGQPLIHVNCLWENCWRYIPSKVIIVWLILSFNTI